MGEPDTTRALVGRGLAQVPDPATAVRQPWWDVARWYALTSVAAVASLIAATAVIDRGGGTGMVLLAVVAAMVGAAQAAWRTTRHREAEVRPTRVSAVSQMLAGAPFVVPFMVIASIADGVQTALFAGAVAAVVWLANRSAYWAVTARSGRRAAAEVLPLVASDAG